MRKSYAADFFKLFDKVWKKSVAADLFFTFPGARMVRLTEDMIVARTRARFTKQDHNYVFFSLKIL